MGQTSQPILLMTQVGFEPFVLPAAFGSDAYFCPYLHAVFSAAFVAGG